MNTSNKHSIVSMESVISWRLISWWTMLFDLFIDRHSYVDGSFAFENFFSIKSRCEWCFYLKEKLHSTSFLQLFETFTLVFIEWMSLSIRFNTWNSRSNLCLWSRCKRSKILSIISSTQWYSNRFHQLNSWYPQWI